MFAFKLRADMNSIDKHLGGSVGESLEKIHTQTPLRRSRKGSLEHNITDMYGYIMLMTFMYS